MSRNPYVRWNTDVTTTTASGTTCTYQNERWHTTTAAASAGPSIAIALGGIASAVTSAGQSLCWAASPPHYYRGPSRMGGRGYTRERIGCHCEGRDSRINREQRRKQEKIKKNAHDVSMKLLKQWLSEMEYNYLMEQGQLELPSQYEKDTIYIVKKDALAKVKIASKKKISCIHQPLIIETGDACININTEYPVGDILLSKIALLKSDEKQFLDIANVNYYPPRVPIRTAFQFDPGHIVRERGTNFWFVQLNERGQCNTAFETSRHLRFEHINHQEVPSESVAIGNDILIPQSGQYFIWSLDMIYAVNRARKFYKERQRDIELHTEEAARDVEREYYQQQQQAVGFVARWDPCEAPLVSYATSTDGPTYTVTRLGQEEPYNEQR